MSAPPRSVSFLAPPFTRAPTLRLLVTSTWSLPTRKWSRFGRRWSAGGPSRGLPPPLLAGLVVGGGQRLAVGAGPAARVAPVRAGRVGLDDEVGAVQNAIPAPGSTPRPWQASGRAAHP